MSKLSLRLKRSIAEAKKDIERGSSTYRKPAPRNKNHMDASKLKSQLRLYWRRLGSGGWDEVLERALDTMKEFQELKENPSPYTLIRSAMSIGRTLQAPHLYIDDILDHGMWKKMFHHCIKQQLIEILTPHVTSKTKISSSGDTILYMIEKEGVHIAWSCDHTEHYTTDIVAHVDNFESSVEFTRQQLWKCVDPNRVVVSTVGSAKKGSNRHRGDTNQLCVVTDENASVAPSKFALEYGCYLKKYLDADIKRSILFYGPPGSGKSCATRTICENLKLRSLRIRVEDIGDLGTEPINELVDVFAPDVIIFDDLDRATSQVALFETLETLHSRVKIIFATVNHPDSLADAIRRPGRFEEIILISKLDDDSIRAILGAEFQDAFDTVREWPVAFIQEYVIRRKIHGKDKAESSVKELRERVKELMDGYEEDSEEDAKE